MKLLRAIGHDPVQSRHPVGHLPGAFPFPLPFRNPTE